MSSNRLFPLFQRTTRGQFARELGYKCFVLISWIPAVIFLNEHVGEFTFIHGPSMYPYLNKDFHETLAEDLCWTNKWNPSNGLRRGMLVSFRPSNPEIVSIKRVIALEGDQVIPRAPYPYPIAEIPAAHIWVEGDNVDATKTLDSNHYGSISLSLVTGKVTYILWPWRSFGPVRWWEFKGRTRVITGRKDAALQWD